MVWCSACGAYGETAPKLLTQPCRGDPRGRSDLRGMAAQLRQLRKDKHPTTQARLGPPIPLHQLNGGPDEPNQLSQDDGEPMRSPVIDRDGTAFSDAFRRRGRQQKSRDTGSTVRERVRAKEANHLLQRSGNKRKIEEFLNPVERSDPDMVSFWTEAAPQASIETRTNGNRNGDKLEAGSNDAPVHSTQWASDEAAAAKRRKLEQDEAGAGGATNPARATRLQRLGVVEGARSARAAPRASSETIIKRSGNSVPISVGNAFKQLVAQASKGMRWDTMKRTNENRVMSSRLTAEKPAGSTTSEEVPGTGSTSAADGVCGASSSSGSTAVLVKRGGGTRVIVGESNFEQMAPDVVKQVGKRVADGTDDQETKKI